MKSLQNLAYELKRCWWLIAVIAFGFITQPEFGVVVFNITVAAAVIVLAHLTRKALFPYVKLEQLYRDVIEDNNGAAAAVLLGFLGFVLGLLYCVMAFMK